MFLDIFFRLLAYFVIYTSPPDSVQNPWEEIAGRTEDQKPIYRIRAADGWMREDPRGWAYLTDSTLPNCSFMKSIDNETVTLHIHTFPIQKTSIPPAAQVARWKKQIEDYDPLSSSSQPISWGGFWGLFFESIDEEKGLLAWALSVGDEQRNRLEMEGQSVRTADVTLKITGSSSTISSLKRELIVMCESFEFIEELP